MPNEQLALVLDRFATIPERAPTGNVKRVVSPGGEWFLAEDQIEAAAFRRRNPGAAVFTKRELDAMRRPLGRFLPEERQSLLAQLIVLKSVFPDATVESITFRESEEQQKARARWQDF